VKRGLNVVQTYTELNELMNGFDENKLARYAEIQIY
jgi:hypothetical protein